ncbi:unnamed protein product [Penicillium salamii]|uniref:Glutamate decarboxylase n=1 Tax=Penicillium salamii TaxID=1612424 RepID=A0A9W4JYZ3_9EURO|nr:unnamed protein product [Penicillium salamii]CAG8360732.1 unnamed protein product [Penicillium salamii]CAG8421007.1 unnamed protein product [Penicillium salamii]CAG8424363.1 unnamed protein product [Penicillium salamii]
MPSNEILAPHPLSTSIPHKGASMDSVEAMIHKQMAGDVPPSRDLGRFTTTKHDNTATRLFNVGNARNQACIEEYPSIASFQTECVSIIAGLWNAPSTGFMGTATTGSSEAVLLGGLTMKRQWQIKQPDVLNSCPNVIIGANAHICVNKFAGYFNVEARIVPVSESTGFAVDAEALRDMLDENTVGVFLTLGSTYTGHYDPIQRIANILDDYESRTGHDIPIHVDAASGGFVAPFTPSNETFIWDFRLPRVQSINASGHKYGMAPLAVGWMVWRDKSKIPQELLLESSYLRGSHTNFSLSFSRSGAPIVGQYYSFHRLGLAGYRERVQTMMSRANLLGTRLEDTGYFSCLADSRRLVSHKANEINTCCQEGRCTEAPELPIVVFGFSEHVLATYPKLRLSDVSNAMHDLKFSIPNYTLAGWRAQGEDIDIMRVVIRDEMTIEVLEEVLTGLTNAVECLIR